MKFHYLAVLALVLFLAALLSACGGSSSGETTDTDSSNRHSVLQSKESARQLRKEEKSERQLMKRIAKEERIEEREQRQAKKKRQEAKKKQEEGPPGVDPIAAEEFHSYSGTDRSNWETAFSICAVTPEKQLAKEFHTSQNWATIGHAYGQDYREPFNIAAEEGCMIALKDTQAQREAAFKMMEEAES